MPLLLFISVQAIQPKGRKGLNRLLPNFSRSHHHPLPAGKVPTQAGKLDGALENTRRLLGELVPELFRDESGALALDKIPARSFEEFQKWLSHWAGVNDGKSFRNPYQSLIQEERFQDLLKAVFAQHEKAPADSHENSQRLAAEFNAAFIGVDADRYVSNRFGTQQGREEIRNSLKEAKYFSRDLQADLAKAIARKAEQDKSLSDIEIHAVTHQISLWNYLNLGVSDLELTRALDGAFDILKSADFQETQNQVIADKENKAPEFLSIMIPPEEYQTMQNYAAEHGDSTLSVERLKSHLAKAIVVLANHRHWSGHDLPEGATEMRQRAIAQLQRAFLNTDQIKSSADLTAFNEQLREQLKGSLGSGDRWDQWRHVARGNGWDRLFRDLPAETRQAFESLRNLSEDWHHATDMGETLSLGTKKDIKFGKLIEGLESAKLQLWSQYKQHKTLSRVLAQGGDLAFEAGDVTDIRQANRYLEDWILRLQKEPDNLATAQALKDSLFQETKADGILAKAFIAAEMDGSEHMLNLAQTCIELAALTAATEGLGLVGEVAETAQGLQRLSRTEAFLNSATLGFKQGAAISFSENGLALISGEARQGAETLENWTKDALATGGSMALSQGVQASFFGQENTAKGLFQNLVNRYTGQGLKSVRHLAADTAIEFGEESIDQYSRQFLDGKTQALSGHELQENFMITLGGGVIHQGYQASTLIKNQGNTFQDSQKSVAEAKGIFPELAESNSPLLTSVTAMAALMTPAPDASQHSSHWQQALLAILGAGMIASNFAASTKFEKSQKAISKFREYLKNDAKLQEELASGYIAEVDLLPFLTSLEEKRPQLLDPSSEIIALKFLAKGLRRFRRLSWPPPLAVKFLTDTLRAWAHDRGVNPNFFKDVYTDAPSLHRRLKKLGWENSKIQATLLGISARTEDPVSINFWALNQLLKYLKDWDPKNSNALLETFVRSPSSIYHFVEPMMHLLAFSEGKNYDENQHLKLIDRLTVFGPNFSSGLYALAEHCMRLQDFSIPATEDLSPYFEPYIDIITHLFERLAPDEAKASLFRYRFTTQKDASVVPAQIVFLQDFLSNHPEGHLMLAELAEARRAELIPENPSELPAANRQIDKFIETTGSFVSEAFEKYQITRHQEKDGHYFLIQEKASLASGDPREIRVRAPYLKDAQYFPLLWEYLDLNNSPRLKERSQNIGDFVALEEEIQIDLLQNPMNQTATRLEEILRQASQGSDPVRTSGMNGSLLAFGTGLATFFGSSIAEAAVSALPSLHTSPHWQAGAVSAALAGIFLGAIATRKRDASKIFQELPAAAKELFDAFEDQFKNTLPKVIKSGLSLAEFLEYFQLHHRRLKDFKGPVLGSYTSLALPNAALEAFASLPWNSQKKLNLLLTSLNVYLDSRQENVENLQNGFRQIAKFYPTLERLGWSENRKYRFILNVIKNSEDYTARALESIESFIDKKLPLWGKYQTSRFIEALTGVAKEQYGLFDILSGLMEDWTDNHIAQEVQRDRVYRLLKTSGSELLAALEVLVQQQNGKLTEKSLPIVMEILTTRPEIEKFYSGVHHYLVEIDNMPEQDQMAHLEFLRDLNRDFPLGASVENLAEARKTSPRLIPNSAEELAKIIPFIREPYQSTGTFDLRIYPNYRVERTEEDGRHFFLIQEKDGTQEDPKELKILAPFLQDPEYFKLILDHLDLGKSRTLRPRSEQAGDFYPIDPGIDLLLLENPGNLGLRIIAKKLEDHRIAPKSNDEAKDLNSSAIRP